METIAVRGPMLRVSDSGQVDFLPDGVAVIEGGRFGFVGDWGWLAQTYRGRVERSRGVIVPPFVDIHTHIPQWPIRGKFVEGVPKEAAGGQLLAGLRKNVFPAEARTIDDLYTTDLVSAFAKDTLSHGVVGGCTYLTPFARACRIALSMLNPHWSVGLVLMNQNCPDDLRTDEATIETDVNHLFEQFGKRLVLTDRFAVAVSSDLRRRCSRLARRLGLRTQTHLNEQAGEKEFVERVLYPAYRSYTDVYAADGLFDVPCIVAHCIEMREFEWKVLKDRGCAIAHCPTSNLLLGSNTMQLDEVMDRQIPFAIATDVGASPTQSMLAEMGRFLWVHAQAGSRRATPELAFSLATRAPAKILGLDLGLLLPNRPATFCEVTPTKPIDLTHDAGRVIEALLPADLNNPAKSVARVWRDGKVLWQTVD